MDEEAQMKRVFGVLLLGLMFVVVGGAALAQDAQPMTGTPSTLEEVAADSPSFWGQTVMLEGLIAEFISTNIFVLHEGEAVDDDAVLVINNSGQPLPNSYIKGQAIIISGRILPSFAEITADPAIRLPSYYEDMGGMMPGMANTGSMDTMATADPAMAGTPSDATGPVATLDSMGMSVTPAEGATADPAMMATADPATMATADLALLPTTDPNMAGTEMPTSEGDMSMTATMDPAMSGTDTASATLTMDPNAMTTPMIEATPGAITLPADIGGYTWEDTLSIVYGDNLPDQYDVYTILELTSISQLAYPPAEG
jgi:hypothetical protein